LQLTGFTLDVIVADPWVSSNSPTEILSNCLEASVDMLAASLVTVSIGAD